MKIYFLRGLIFILIRVKHGYQCGRDICSDCRKNIYSPIVVALIILYIIIISRKYEEITVVLTKSVLCALFYMQFVMYIFLGVNAITCVYI